MKNVALLTAICAFGLTGAAKADVVFADDLIVSDDACFGADCADLEPFPTYHQVKFKSITPPVYFEDTTPSLHDWRLQANTDDVNGFYLRNEDTTNTPFTILGNAPSNSLFVAADGNVGLGTSLPEGSLHVIDTSGTAELVLESGANEKWRAEVGSSGFALRDLTTSAIPLVFEHGAPEATFWALADGKVGMGTGTPSAAVHLKRSDGSAKFLVEESSIAQAVREMFQMKNNGGSYFTLTNTQSGRDWFFSHENAAQGRFIITSSTNPSKGLFLDPDGDLKIGGTITTGGGTCGGGCDAVFTDDYNLPSISEHTEAMYDLGYLPNVGPTPENAPINVSDKLGRMLNELEHAHIYIDQLHVRQETQSQELKEARARDANQQAQIQSLMARLEALEVQ